MLQNLTKNIRWELAKFFTNYPVLFLFPIIVCEIPYDVYVLKITDSVFCMSLLAGIITFPTAWIFLSAQEELTFFKLFGFKIETLYCKDIFVTWKKTIKTIEKFMQENEIKYFLKEGFMEDYKIVFKHSEDSNYTKIAMENDSFPAQP